MQQADSLIVAAEPSIFSDEYGTIWVSSLIHRQSAPTFPQRTTSHRFTELIKQHGQPDWEVYTFDLERLEALG